MFVYRSNHLDLIRQPTLYNAVRSEWEAYQRKSRNLNPSIRARPLHPLTYESIGRNRLKNKTNFTIELHGKE